MQSGWTGSQKAKANRARGRCWAECGIEAPNRLLAARRGDFREENPEHPLVRAPAGARQVKLTPLSALTFFMSATKLFETLSQPAQAVYGSSSLDQANDALHAIGIKTALDSEREILPGSESLAD